MVPRRKSMLPRRVKPSKPRKGRKQRMGAPVATRWTVSTAKAAKEVSITGTDILSHVADISKLKRGDAVLDQLVEPAMLSRLDKIGGMYQMIKYASLEFNVTSGSPTSQTGSYVCAFVKDATDDYQASTEDIVARLIANAGAKVQKAWDSTIVRITDNRWFYTSPGNSQRWSSPGRFLIVMDGVASQPGSITVTCRWSVHLKTQTLEAVAQTVPSLIVTAPVTLGTGWHLWGPKQSVPNQAIINDWATSDFDLLNPRQDYFYRLVNSRFEWYWKEESVGSDRGSSRCMKIWHNPATSTQYPKGYWTGIICDVNGKDLNGWPKESTPQGDLVMIGEELVPFEPESGNVTGGATPSHVRTMVLHRESISRSQPWSLWKQSLLPLKPKYIKSELSKESSKNALTNSPTKLESTPSSLTNTKSESPNWKLEFLQSELQALQIELKRLKDSQESSNTPFGTLKAMRSDSRASSQESINDYESGTSGMRSMAFREI